MKNYAIYQFFIDRRGQERTLLVGFVKAENPTKAKEEFTDDEFRRGYLSTLECSEKENERPDLKEAIQKNIAELGVWANKSN